MMTIVNEISLEIFEYYKVWFLGDMENALNLFVAKITLDTSVRLYPHNITFFISPVQFDLWCLAVLFLR